MCINNLLFVLIIINFVWKKYFIIIRTIRTSLYSNVHLHTRSVIQGQRVILHSRFRIKPFICSQCDRNYLFSVLIKIKQQLNCRKAHFTMRLLLHCNKHHLLAIECFGSCKLEMDRMSKLAYPRMRIHMRVSVRRYPRMRTRMRIFVTCFNNTSYCQMGAAFVTEYRLLHYTEY